MTKLGNQNLFAKIIMVRNWPRHKRSSCWRAATNPLTSRYRELNSHNDIGEMSLDLTVESYHVVLGLSETYCVVLWVFGLEQFVFCGISWLPERGVFEAMFQPRTHRQTRYVSKTSCLWLWVSGQLKLNLLWPTCTALENDPSKLPDGPFGSMLAVFEAKDNVVTVGDLSTHLCDKELIFV
jgi:hypothetical protein